MGFNHGFGGTVGLIDREIGQFDAEGKLVPAAA
jgi:hypothetical protein